MLLLAAGTGPAAHAQLTPIGLTAASFTQDLVAESGSNPQAVTTAALDGGGNNIFYSLGFAAINSTIITSGGLPNNGVFTSGVNSWQMAAYTGNNALFFGPESVVSTQSMYLSTPGQYSEISLLDAAGYGPTSVTITLNFSNGTSTNYGTFSILDWFGGTPYVADNLGRINRNSTVSNNNAPAGDPCLYQTVITLNSTDQEKTLTRRPPLPFIVSHKMPARYTSITVSPDCRRTSRYSAYRDSYMQKEQLRQRAGSPSICNHWSMAFTSSGWKIKSRRNQSNSSDSHLKNGD